MVRLAREGHLPPLKAARMSAPAMKIDYSNCSGSSDSEEEEEKKGVVAVMGKGVTNKVVTPEKDGIKVIVTPEKESIRKPKNK